MTDDQRQFMAEMYPPTPAQQGNASSYADGYHAGHAAGIRYASDSIARILDDPDPTLHAPAIRELLRIIAPQ